MDTTPKLNLPLIAEAQAQKHVTHNEALERLDALVQATVLDRDLTSPPASPNDGDAYIVAASATGDWSGHDGEIARFQNGGWLFLAPRKGWLAHVEDEDIFVVFDGAQWQPFQAGAQTFTELTDTPASYAGYAGKLVAVNAAQNGLEFVDAPATGVASLNPADGGQVGINTTADATNRLAVKSDAVLFSHDDVSGAGSGDVRFKVNKAAATNTASLLFQDNWAGRAEIGLAGDDDFRLKVSPDGSTWREAFRVDRNDGSVTVPAISGNGSGLTNVDAARLGGKPASAYAELSGSTFTGRLRAPRIYVGHPNNDRNASSVGAASLELGGWSGAWACNVQDGSGRVNFRWNATAGARPTFLVNGDRAVEWDIDGWGSMGLSIRLSQPNPGAGSAVRFNTLFALGDRGIKGFVPFILPSRSVSNLPSASAAGAGALIFVPDEAGGPTVAFSDGTNWRRVQDRAIVS